MTEPAATFLARLDGLITRFRRLDRATPLIPPHAEGEPAGYVTVTADGSAYPWAGRNGGENPAGWLVENGRCTAGDVPRILITVGDAIDLLEHGAAELAEAADAHLRTCVDAFIAPELRPAALARCAPRWPWPATPAGAALRGLLAALDPALPQELASVAIDLPGVAPLDVARWAAPLWEGAEGLYPRADLAKARKGDASVKRATWTRHGAPLVELVRRGIRPALDWYEDREVRDEGAWHTCGCRKPTPELAELGEDAVLLAAAENDARLQPYHHAHIAACVRHVCPWPAVALLYLATHTNRCGNALRRLERYTEAGELERVAGVLLAKVELDAARDNHAARLLAAEVENRGIRPFLARVGAVPASEADAGREVGGMLWLDAALWDLLAELGKADVDVDAGRENARERWRTGDHAAQWRVWSSDAKVDGHMRAVGRIAETLWTSSVRERWEREKGARPFELRHVAGPGGDAYAKVPKLVSGFRWAMGTTGERVAMGDDEYAAAPGIVRYVAQSPVLPMGRRPVQLAIRIDERELPSALRMVHDTQYLISPVAAKAALFLAVTAPDVGLMQSTLGDFVCAMNPGRRIQQRDIENHARALRDVRACSVELPGGTDVHLFDLEAPRRPETATADMPVVWGWPATLRNALLREAKNAMRVFNGAFVVNLTAVMRLTGNEPLELRTYLAAAAAWNDSRRGKSGKYHAEATPLLTPEQWAEHVNALSPAARQYLQEHTGRNRRPLAEDKRRMRTALERLEAKGMLRLEAKGNRVRPLPTEALNEAYAEMRRRGAREDG